MEKPEPGPDAPTLEPTPGPKRSCLRWVAGGAAFLVLTAILLPNFIRSGSRGKITACKSNLKNIGTALEMYSTDYSGRYPNSLDVLTPNYLKSIPECPKVAQAGWWSRKRKGFYRVIFGPGAPMNSLNGRQLSDYYYVECFGENHSEIGVTGNYPAYNGIQGLIERAP
jgi:hypothetical protein